MDRRFENKTALVTGGGRNLGRAVAIALAKRGCKVTVFARTESELDTTLKDIAAAGGVAHAVIGDVTTAGDVERAADETERIHGGLDILINAAGGFKISPSLAGDIDAWKAMLEVNLVGAYRACVAAARRMRDRGGGRIVTFGSILSVTAFPERAAYAASKAGLVHMTRVLAIEWACHGIGVNSVLPGMIAIDTPHPLVARGQIRDEAIVARIPAGRRGTPEDIIGPVLFLASEDSAYVVGQTLVVDGGWTSYGYL